MLKAASSLYVQYLTEVVNESYRVGRVPESLLKGEMTLTDEKEPFLEVGKKRPITVSSVLLSVFTKLMHKRMDSICEKQKFYGPIQYGFRSKRSTVDCVFMIVSALKAAKRRNQPISLAFCDIAKAYNSVCRDLSGKAL